MKKVYLLLIVGLLAATISASAQNVILRLDNRYDVSIDNRFYQGNKTLSNLGNGRHSLIVYEAKGGILGVGRKRTPIANSGFDLRNNDVVIDVDQYGQLRINQLGNYNTQTRGYDPNTNDRRYGQDDENYGKRYGRENTNGRGHKYGHYKNNNGKSKKAYKNHREDDDDDEQ